jgi:hypothetical protein
MCLDVEGQVRRLPRQRPPLTYRGECIGPFAGDVYGGDGRYLGELKVGTD